MDLRYLEAFLEAVQGPTLAAAARRLHIAPSALTRQLQLFEESVGQKLFLRSNRNTQPSHQALAIAELAKEFQKKSAAALGKDTVHTLNFWTLEGALNGQVIPFLQKHSLPENLNLDLRISSSPDIEAGLKKGQIDAGILSWEVNHPLLECRVLAVEKMVLISSHPVSLKELHKHRWIYVFEGSYLNKISNNPSPLSLRVGSLAALFPLVKSNLGIAIVPDHSIPSKTGLFIQELPKLQTESLYLCNRKELPLISKETLLKFARSLPKP